jgi:hypothetical protein
MPTWLSHLWRTLTTTPLDHQAVSAALRSASNESIRIVSQQIVSRSPMLAIQDAPDYKKALEFNSKHEPRSDRDYKWIWQYAEQNFLRWEDANKYLDEKADSLIKYLGGGTGLFTILSITSAKSETLGIIAWAIPAVVAALIATAFAIWARTPATAFAPPSIEGAIIYTNEFAEKDRAVFLGQWHLASEGMRLAVKLKAGRVKFASVLYVTALILLLIPLIVAVSQQR